MKEFRKQVHDFIKATECLLSSESFDAPLTSDERAIIGMYAQDLCQRYPQATEDGFDHSD
jgi:hypothetical protein